MLYVQPILAQPESPGVAGVYGAAAAIEELVIIALILMGAIYPTVTGLLFQAIIEPPYSSKRRARAPKPGWLYYLGTCVIGYLAGAFGLFCGMVITFGVLRLDLLLAACVASTIAFTACWFSQAVQLKMKFDTSFSDALDAQLPVMAGWALLSAIGLVFLLSML